MRSPLLEAGLSRAASATLALQDPMEARARCVLLENTRQQLAPRRVQIVYQASTPRRWVQHPMLSFKIVIFGS